MNPTLRLLPTRLGATLLLAGGLLAARPATAQWVTQNSNLPANYGINSISIVDANNVWASSSDFGNTNPQGTNGNNIYTRTTNGGGTWTPGAITSLPATQAIVSISAASPTVAWAATDNLAASGGRVYYTADGGTTWTQQLSTGFTSANGFVNGVLAFSTTQAVAAGDPAPAANFEIYYTSNAGTTWTAATTPARLSATEGGLTTTVVTVPGTNAAARSCWMGTSAGRVLRSTDSGVTWAIAATGLTQVTGLAFSSTTNGIAVDAQAGTVASTADGGATWSAARTPTGPFYPSTISGVPGQPNTFVSAGILSSTSYGSSYSTNNGRSWVALDTDVHYTVAFLNGTTGYSGGISTSTLAGGGMYKGTLPAAALGTSVSRSLPGLAVYPNPATDNFTVAVPAVAGAALVQATLYNALGQPVAHQQATLPAAGTQLSFPAANLAAGLYTLRVQAGETVASQQVSLR